MNKDLVLRKKKLNVTISWNNTNMFNFDCITKENMKEHNPNWPEIPDHPYRILIVEVLGLEKQMLCLIK